MADPDTLPASISIEDLAHAAARGVLRALEAGGASLDARAQDLGRAGVFVDIRVRAGALPDGSMSARLNPQPEPPGAAARG